MNTESRAGTAKYNEKREIKLEAFGRLLDVMDRLRVECPWDREQTMESLRNCTIEETYELVDAVASGDYDGVRQELGDLLLHVVFYAKIADQEHRFDISDVINFLCEKLIFRHPHVFGEVKVSDAEQVLHNWEQLKLKEKKTNRGILGGVPTSLPAMVKAYRMGEKAASAGFDWEKKEDVWTKVKEEVAEIEAEMSILTGDVDNHTRLEEEFGDMFFAMINAARLYGVDPELALDRCNKRFMQRFNHIEQRAEENKKRLSELSLKQMEEWWQEAKERASQSDTDNNNLKGNI